MVVTVENKDHGLIFCVHWLQIREILLLYLCLQIGVCYVLKYSAILCPKFLSICIYGWFFRTISFEICLILCLLADSSIYKFHHVCLVKVLKESGLRKTIQDGFRRLSFVTGADLYTTNFSHTQQLLLQGVELYNPVKLKLLYMAKMYCAQITTLSLIHWGKDQSLNLVKSLNTTSKTMNFILATPVPLHGYFPIPFML